MAYQDIANVQISLDTGGLTAQGFGTPLFASEHTNFPERVRAYTSLTAVAEDFATSDSAYKAAQGYFGNTPSPSVIKIGRQEVGESASDLLAAITAEDDDFYFFSAEDHSETFVLAAAADIEARTKMYFVSIGEQDALTAYSAGSATDILGQLADFDYKRTAGFFHDLADTDFPETTYVGKRAWELAGATNWTNLQVSLPPSKDPSTGNPLSATQKGNLEDRNAAYVEIQNAQLSVLRGGRVASGEKVDTIRGRDGLTEDMTIAYKNQLIDSDIPYNNSGITTLKGTCKSVLDRYADRGFINDNYVVDFPNIGFVPDADKQAGIYQQGTFKAELTGSIDIVEITGSLVITL